MTPTGNLESLADALEVLERARLSDHGVRLRFAERGKAVNFRQRLYTARKRDRRLDTGGLNKSIYDGLVVGQVKEISDAATAKILGYEVLVRKSENPHGMTIEEL